MSHNDAISRKALVSKCQLNFDVLRNGWPANIAFLEDILDAPALDAVPVVRCGECKWVSTCKACGDYLGKNGFCSRGVREVKDDAD